MNSVVSFFKSRQFVIQLVIILVVIFLVFFGTIRFLSAYTNHGKYVVVPDFTGKMVLSLPDFVKDKDVSYEIIDSIYDPKEKPGIVLRQDPEPNSKVKHNRTVYLYVTGLVPPQVVMPKLVDRSERQARLIIETYGLRFGKVELREADCNGCVLAAKVNGMEITQGTPIKKGSVVSIVVGSKDPIPGDADSNAVAPEGVPEF
jgi:eukaryotic-like serine/threonine-protein kinase